MKQSGHLNPSEETGTGCHVTSKYGRTPPNKHGCVGRQQEPSSLHNSKHTTHTHATRVQNTTLYSDDTPHIK